MKQPKPCPFCGRRPKVSKVTDLSYEDGLEKFEIVCEHYRCNVNPKEALASELHLRELVTAVRAIEVLTGGICS